MTRALFDCGHNYALYITNIQSKYEKVNLRGCLFNQVQMLIQAHLNHFAYLGKLLWHITKLQGSLLPNCKHSLVLMSRFLEDTVHFTGS